MKKLERGSIRYLIVLTIAVVIGCIVIFPILDFLVSKFITHNNFIYSIQEYILEPIIIGVIVGLCTWIIDRKNMKK